MDVSEDTVPDVEVDLGNLQLELAMRTQSSQEK